MFLNAPHRRLRGARWISPLAATFILLLLRTVFVAQAYYKEGMTLHVGMEAPVVLDPAQGSNDPETALNRAIYDYLVELKPDASIAPNLAKEWTISEDGLTYTFRLEEGVTFHDGSPFSSADVVFTFNRLKEIGSPATRLLGDFTVEAPDASTVVFKIAKPNADFLYGVASRFALILKDGTTTPNELAEGDNPYVNFNGTGPFTLMEYNVGQDAVLIKNKNYWKEGQPVLDALHFIYFSGDYVTQLNALLDGQVDLIYKVPIAQVPALEGNENISIIQQPTSRHAVIRLRADTGPGTDVRVRQAFKYATDREELNNLLTNGLGSVGNNDPIAPVFGVFYTAVENQTYDPAKACELLKEAGYPDGLAMTLYAPNALEYPDLAAALQSQWKAGCINVDIQVLEAGQYYDTSDPNSINWCSVELGITGWGDRPVPQQFLVEAYVSSAIDPVETICTNGYNESRWSDSELDDLVAQASVTADPAARKEIYSKISAIFLERGPIIIPYFAPMIGAANTKVEGLELAPFPGLTDYRTVSVEE